MKFVMPVLRSEIGVCSRLRKLGTVLDNQGKKNIHPSLGLPISVNLMSTFHKLGDTLPLHTSGSAIAYPSRVKNGENRGFA
jgi:hypothetical protein